MKQTVKKLGLTLALFSFLALIPMSCGVICNDSCGCGPSAFRTQQMNIKSLDVLTISSTGQEINPSQAMAYDQVFKGIRVKEFDIIKLSEKSVPNQSTFGLALACSQPPLISEEKFQTIQVINRKEFALSNGTQVLKGEDITDLFGINSIYVGTLLPLNVFVDSGRNFILEEYFKLGLLEAPEEPISFFFDLKVKFDNGKEFIFTDQNLNIN
ncbi:MAG: hypothetical protein ACK4SF_10205 [Algoriphagus aquaeductus]|uniref:hypothetical protein n=1 Tax=Algoriphagus aquaeductus TaxID=475299 RepID=UPI00391A3924